MLDSQIWFSDKFINCLSTIKKKEWKKNIDAIYRRTVLAEPIAEYKCLNSATSFNDLSSASWKGSSEPNVPSNVAVKSLVAIESQLLNDRLFCLTELGDEFVEWIGVGKFNVFVVNVDGTTYCCWLPVGQ
jgi:hypothetical protein